MNFSIKTLELPLILDKVLSYTFTNEIKERVLNLQFNTSLGEVNILLEEVNEMLFLIEEFKELPFYNNYDIRNYLTLIDKHAVLSLLDVLKVIRYLHLELDFVNYNKELTKQNYETIFLKPYLNNINQTPLLSFINKMVDFDNGLIKDDATPELYDVRRKIMRFNVSFKQRLDQLLNSFAPYLSENLVVMRNDRYCFPIKDTYKNKVKGVIHDVSGSGQTLYIEPDQLIALMSQKELLLLEEKKEIQKILSIISNEIFKYNHDLFNNISLILNLELIFAKAKYAKITNSKKPYLNDQGIINIKSARHPLLDDDIVVPIDIVLEKDDSLLMITGSNTGGKTVALKTVGLLTLLVQHGFLVPVDENSNFAIFNKIYADIGDEQSIEQSLSTFSSHITKIIHMIENFEDNTLILLDEIGSGTDPVEGVSLAISIIEHFLKKEVKLVITTHYSELKYYAYENPNMKTASVAFDTKTLRPLYKLHLNTLGSSHALLIAKRLGIPVEVIDNATSLSKDKLSDTSYLIEKLNEEQQQFIKKREELELKTTELELKINEYNNLMTAWKKKEAQMLNDLKFKEERNIEKLKTDLKVAIKDARLNRDDQSKANELLQAKLGKDKVKIDEEFNVGDKVLITTYQQYGEILEIKNKKAFVRFGNFELWFKLSELTKFYEKEVKKPQTIKPKAKPTSSLKLDTKIELDLRGVRYEEVRHLLEEAVDNALLSNLEHLKIIHGYGTFAVKKAVDEYISSSPFIKSKRAGGENEGGLGVTVIYFK